MNGIISTAFRTRRSRRICSTSRTILSQLTKAGNFEPGKFEDQYETALKELIRRKQAGKPIERPDRREPARVINLMDALRRSVQSENKPKAREPARAAPSTPRRAPAKRSAGRRKTG